MLKEILHKFFKNTGQEEKPSSLEKSYHLWWNTHSQSTEGSNNWIIGDREIILQKLPSFYTVSTFLQKEKENTLQHFSVHAEQGALHFSPILSDRSLLISLTDPQWILYQQPLSLYVLSPIWIKISLFQMMTSAQETLCELSSQSARLCWSGLDKLTGDLCYNSLVEIHTETPHQWAPWQVMTPIVFINQGKKPLLIKEALLPHPFLNLCLKPNGQLYTFSTHCHYQEDTIDVRLNADGGAEQDQMLGARNHSAHELKISRLLASMQPI